MGRCSTRSRAGHTLIELAIVVVMMGLFAAAALPRFSLALEQGRVDQVGGMLQAIWIAQRMHWLEHHGFADDLQDLVDLQLIEEGVLHLSDPFSYSIIVGDSSVFTARARRNASVVWTGSITIDELGNMVGSTSDGGGHSVSPTTID